MTPGDVRMGVCFVASLKVSVSISVTVKFAVTFDVTL